MNYCPSSAPPSPLKSFTSRRRYSFLTKPVARQPTNPQDVPMVSIRVRSARRSEVRKLALTLIAQHGLHDWTVAFNKRKRTLGLCRYGVKAIELSVYLVDRNGEEEIRDTILHEIVHALV